MSEQFELKSGWGLGLYGAHWVCILQTTWSISEQVLWAEVWLRSGSSWCSLGLHPPDHLKHQWASTLSWSLAEVRVFMVLAGSLCSEPLEVSGENVLFQVSRGWDLQVAVLRIRMPSRALSWMSVQNNRLLQNEQNYFIWMSVQNNRLLQNEQNILSECQCKTIGCYRMNKIFYLNVSAKQSVVTEWTKYFIWMSVQNNRLLQNEQNILSECQCKTIGCYRMNKIFYLNVSAKQSVVIEWTKYFIWMSVQNNRLLQNEQNILSECQCKTIGCYRMNKTILSECQCKTIGCYRMNKTILSECQCKTIGCYRMNKTIFW